MNSQPSCPSAYCVLLIKRWKSLWLLPSFCQQRRTLFHWFAKPSHCSSRVPLLLSSRLCSTFGLYCHRKANELAHILQKSEELFDFGFLPLLAAFLGVEEVIRDNNLSTQMGSCCCLQTDTCDQRKKAIYHSSLNGSIYVISQEVKLLVLRR